MLKFVENWIAKIAQERVEQLFKARVAELDKHLDSLALEVADKVKYALMTPEVKKTIDLVVEYSRGIPGVAVDMVKHLEENKTILKSSQEARDLFEQVASDPKYNGYRNISKK